jgi:hypothetical protein
MSMVPVFQSIMRVCSRGCGKGGLRVPAGTKPCIVCVVSIDVGVEATEPWEWGGAHQPQVPFGMLLHTNTEQ